MACTKVWIRMPLYNILSTSLHLSFSDLGVSKQFRIYSRLSLSRNRRDPLKHFEISVLRHIRFVVLRKKQLEQPNFINDYVI